jgi:hypothetical protein
MSIPYLTLSPALGIVTLFNFIRPNEYVIVSIMVLICISLMTDGVEHYSVCV